MSRWTIAPEHRDMARAVAAWLRECAAYPDPDPSILTSLPGWSEYAADEITARAFAERIDAAMPAEWRHVVMFSGGLGSYRAAKIVAREHGTEGLALLFADTLMEDPDLYRFIREAAADVGGTLITITEGRTPWEVFRDVRFLGNSRVDPCSRVLKREPLRKWLTENTDPETCTIYLGIGHDEAHRFENAPKNHAPWKVRAPLCEDVTIPLSIHAARAELDAAGIALPRLYEMGFSHNNCGGFCVKAGHASFRLLLERKPEEYARHEAEEEALRQHLDKDVTVLRDRTGGEATNLTLREFRERIQNGRQLTMFEEFDWGACSCLGAA